MSNYKNPNSPGQSNSGPQGPSLKENLTNSSTGPIATSQKLITSNSGQQALNVLDQAEEKLPVLRFKEQIIESVKNNAVTIITAETGAGKSTQVPIFLQQAGYKVIVTQPRRLAARTVAQRVAQEIKSPLGEKVGFHTSDQRVSSDQTDILFCTDGLQLVRELTARGQKTGGNTVLILDEVHEWNINMEVLIAWTKKRIAAGENLKVVIMSATLDAQKLADFYGQSTPAVEVPGRLYPVEKHNVSAREMLPQIIKLAEQKRNILVFQTGKAEIESTIKELEKSLGDKAHILPLHGDLTPVQQQECFRPAPNGKAKIIVSTNVAQTSVTIPDIDAVVDCGQEKSSETRDGIAGLYIKEISQADCAQRAGRAGRTKPGIYVLCSDHNFDLRSKFPIPEIMRSRLDEMVLKLAEQTFDAASLNFFHQPNVQDLNIAKQSLNALGALDENGKITAVGSRIVRLPLSVKYARMLIEAEKYGVLEEVSAIAACLEAGDIRAKKNPEWTRLTKEKDSDLLAIYDVYTAAKNVRPRAGFSRVETLMEMGVFAKDFFRAQEIQQKLMHEVRSRFNTRKESPKNEQERRKAILVSCLSGLVDHLYQSSGYSYRDFYGVDREKSRDSVVTSNSQLVIALPLDLQTRNKRGNIVTMRLINMVSKVDNNLLSQAAPHLVSTKTQDYLQYNSTEDRMEVTEENFFHKLNIGSTQKTVLNHPKATATLAAWIAQQSSVSNSVLNDLIRSNKEVEKTALLYNQRARKNVAPGFVANAEFYQEKLAGAQSIATIKDFNALKLPALPAEKLAELQKLYPDKITIAGHEFSIEYRPYNSEIYINDEMFSKGVWKDLPDQGVELPSGDNLVFVCIAGGCSSAQCSDLISFKKELHKTYLDKCLNSWVDQKRPSISHPTLESKELEVPFESHIIGKDVYGKDVYAYGVCQVTKYYYGDDLDMNTRWYTDKSEAETVWSESVEVMEIARQKHREKAAYQAVRDQYFNLCESLQAQYNELYSNNIASELLTEIDSFRYQNVPELLSELQPLIENGQELQSRVNITLIEYQTKQQLLAAQQEAASKKHQEMADLFKVAPEEISRIWDLVEFIDQKMGANNAFTFLNQINQAPYGRGRRQADLAEVLTGTDFTGHYLLYTSKAHDFNLGLDLMVRIFEYRMISKKIATQSSPANQKHQSLKDSTAPTASNSKPASAEGLAALMGKFNKKK